MPQPKSKVRWLAEHRKERTKRYLLEYHQVHDADVIAKLDSLTESKQGYIRRLIREDIKKRES